MKWGSKVNSHCLTTAMTSHCILRSHLVCTRMSYNEKSFSKSKTFCHVGRTWHHAYFCMWVLRWAPQVATYWIIVNAFSYQSDLSVCAMYNIVTHYNFVTKVSFIATIDLSLYQGSSAGGPLLQGVRHIFV